MATSLKITENVRSSINKWCESNQSELELDSVTQQKDRTTLRVNLAHIYRPWGDQHEC